jgi:CubicO group peptidase (beta-lactamase class C family)
MKRIISTTLIIFTFNFFAIAQSINTAKLDSFFNVLASRNLAMGSLTISKNGKIKYQRAIGYSSLDGEKKIPANVDTKYRIGSVSKMFTAVRVCFGLY